MISSGTRSPRSTRTRIAAVPLEAVGDPDLRLVLEPAEQLSTPKPAWYLTLAHNPEMAKGYAAYWDLTHRGGTVEHTTNELMRIAIARLLGCEFCADQRSTVAQAAGLDEQQAATCELPDFDLPDPRVRAALRYARTLVLESDPDAFEDVYTELHAVFDDGEIVELGCFAAIAIGGVILSRSLQIPSA